MKAIIRPTLSREGRDTLWLLAVLSLCVAPHVTRLPIWCTAGTIGAMLWRARLAWKDAALPPRIWLLVSLAVSLALTVATFNSVFGREAGITLVTLLAALKTLELRARRDAFVVTSLGFFLILTQFLYSQSLPMAALMTLAVLGLLTSLVLAQRPMGRPTIWSAIKTATRCVVMGIPLMVALFMLFPRLGPLWSLPADAGPHTGLSDRINLGNVADLAQDDSVAMRVRFLDRPPRESDMYFRGPVLDIFDGKTWQSSRAIATDSRESRPPDKEESEPVADPGNAPPVRYQVTVEPNRITASPLMDGTLVAVPTPPAKEPLLRREGLDWQAQSLLTERYQIDAQAWPGITHGPIRAERSLRAWLQLPMHVNPRTIAWAQALRAQPDMQRADPRALTTAVLQHIRNGAYTYTLTPDADTLDPNGIDDPNLIDRFWLDRRRGFCEHFATAYVVIMRAMGVPSRVITGYQGAEYNPVDGLFVVRNSDAHAWAEYWQPGEGWLRVDPTAAVAPDRIERPRPIYRGNPALPGPLSGIDSATLGRLRAYADAANHRWNVWVLQYSRNKQMEMLQHWGFDSPDWLDLVRLCGAVLVAISVLGMGWLWWTRPIVRRSAWKTPLSRIHKILLAAGLPAPAQCPAPAPALSWVQVIRQSRTTTSQQPIQAGLIAALSELDALRYGERIGTRQQAEQIRLALIQRIEQLAQQWRSARRRDKAN